AIGSSREDARLTSFLPAIEQKRPRILEVVTIDGVRQNILLRNRFTVCRHHQANFTGGNEGHRCMNDAILPCPIAKVPSRGERISLIACFAAESNQFTGFEITES